jgi:hypothetical protein
MTSFELDLMPANETEIPPSAVNDHLSLPLGTKDAHFIPQETGKLVGGMVSIRSGCLSLELSPRRLD